MAVVCRSKVPLPLRLAWIALKLFVLLLVLDATETIVLYQNY